MAASSTTAKYGNVPTEVDGQRFDSHAEARRFAELALLLKAGTIRNVTLQPVYVLQPAFTDATGTRHRAITYVADFAYQEGGRLVAEDVKGVETEVFKLKRKLFLSRYPHIELRVLPARRR